MVDYNRQKITQSFSVIYIKAFNFIYLINMKSSLILSYILLLILAQWCFLTLLLILFLLMYIIFLFLIRNHYLSDCTVGFIYILTHVYKDYCQKIRVLYSLIYFLRVYYIYECRNHKLNATFDFAIFTSLSISKITNIFKQHTTITKWIVPCIIDKHV